MDVTGDFHYLSHSLSYTTLVKSIQMTPILPMLQVFVTNIVGRRIESGRSLGGWSWRSLVTSITYAIPLVKLLLSCEFK